MTSKNLCFKLMKEDLKRRVWTTALTILGFLFTLIVPAALKSSSYLEKVMKEGAAAYEQQRLANNLVKIVGINGAVITMLLVLSVIWAVSGFRYLHNSRQVDFYHSLPIKRYQLFLAEYCNGILVPAVFYLIAQGISTALILRTGIGVGSLPWRTFLLNIVYYSMIYTTAVIAMMMTGNIVVALLGTMVFCSYGPAVITLIFGYQQEWFYTLYRTEQQSNVWLQILKNSSPFSNYMFAISDFETNLLSIWTILGAVAVTGVLAAVAYALYRIRPSEAAGKAMTFEKTRSPIKLLIALPVAVVFSIFFYELRSTLAWGIFGAVCGSVLTCCLMEIIYHFDFRKLFVNWIHLAMCCIVSILLFLAGLYDWYGYDSYLPKTTDIKSAAVIMGYSEEWVTYGKPMESADYYDGIKRYTWEYESTLSYVLNHMELTDIYPVMELAQKGVLRNKQVRQNKDDESLYDRRMERYIVVFRLNNGKTVSRQYWFSLDEEGELARASIHDNKEYKKGIYPLLEQTAADTSSVYFQQYNHVSAIELNQDQKSRLLSVYQKELEELTMDQRKKELPIGTIQFRTEEHDKAAKYNEQHRWNNLENRCYYPIYPSFVRTLDVLKEAGVHLTVLDSSDISDINITYYWVDNIEDMEDVPEIVANLGEDRTINYSSKRDIETLAPALVFEDYYSMNQYYDVNFANDTGIYVHFKVPRENFYESRDSLNFRIDLGKLSKEDISRFAFWVGN